MSSEKLTEAEEFLNIIRSDSEGKKGIICLNCLIVRSRFKEIYGFMNRHNIPLPEEQNLSKLELLDHITIHYYKQYQKNPTLKNNLRAPLNTLEIL